MDPSQIPPGLDSLIKLGEVPMGALTVWLLYQIMVTIKVMIRRVETVLELVTGKKVGEE